MSDPPNLPAAARAGDLAGVQCCLAAGVSVDSVDAKNHTALYWSSAKGHLSVVNYLVNQGADIERENGDKKVTALYGASFYGHLPVVTLLVESGADLEHKSSQGYSPVIAAADSGHLPVVQYLAEQGAKLDACTPGGHNATHRAAANGHLNVIKYLEERGCDMNTKTNLGDSPYHVAAYCGQIAIMQYLDSRGMSKEALNDRKMTPIMRAALGGQLAAVKQLVLQRVRTDVVDSQGWGLVHFTVQSGSLNVLKYVREQLGQYAFSKTKKGHTGYHLAAQYGHVHLMVYFEGLAVDVNNTTNLGATSLIIAAEYAKIHIMEHLLNIGADVNVVNNFGSSALHWVCESFKYSSGTDQLTAAQLLVKHGARVDGRNEDGKTPADYVTDNEKLKHFLKESAARSKPRVDPGYASVHIFRKKPADSASASASADDVTERLQCLDLDHKVEIYAPDHPNIRCAVDKICCQFVKSLQLSGFVVL